MLSALAGLPATAAMLTDVAKLEREYFERAPDLDDPYQMVSFGTSGHRGSPLRGSFTESHILAITQAICDFRRRIQGTTGPLYMGKDTHALSGPAQRTALQVLAANGVETVIQQDDGVTPTPVISRSILVHNRDRKDGLADGILITPVAQPAGGWRLQIQFAERRPRRYERRALGGGKGQRTAPRPQRGRQTRADDDGPAGATTHHEDFVMPYVRDLRERGGHGRDPGCRPQTRRGSAGRRRQALLGIDQLGLRPGHRNREPGHRPDVLLHDRGSRRRNPHGLFQPLRDGPRWWV